MSSQLVSNGSTGQFVVQKIPRRSLTISGCDKDITIYVSYITNIHTEFKNM